MLQHNPHSCPKYSINILQQIYEVKNMIGTKKKSKKVRFFSRDKLCRQNFTKLIHILLHYHSLAKRLLKPSEEFIIHCREINKQKEIRMVTGERPSHGAFCQRVPQEISLRWLRPIRFQRFGWDSTNQPIVFQIRQPLRDPFSLCSILPIQMFLLLSPFYPNWRIRTVIN